MTTIHTSTTLGAGALLLAAYRWVCHTMPWPEIASNGMPRTPREIIGHCPSLVGQNFVTVSEHIILWFQREVREGRLKPEEVVIRYYVSDSLCRSLRLDENGDFLDDWPGGFFTERLELLR